jgi:hypothetical protein
VTQDVRRNGPSQGTAFDARRPEVHSTEDAGIGHFFNGKVEPDEGAD